MSKEEITPEEETQEVTPPEGNDSKDLSDEQFLAKVNEIEGRNYKSVEDYQKTVKNRNAEFAKLGQKKETEKVTPSLAEEILLVKKPELEFVRDDLRRIADKHYDGDVFKASQEETWLEDKAKNLAEKKRQQLEAEGKLTPPSSQIQGDKNSKIKLSDADKRLMAKYGLSEEDLNK